MRTLDYAGTRPRSSTFPVARLVRTDKYSASASKPSHAFGTYRNPMLLEGFLQDYLEYCCYSRGVELSHGLT
jgi:hypothetical protein